MSLARYPDMRLNVVAALEALAVLCAFDPAAAG